LSANGSKGDRSPRLPSCDHDQQDVQNYHRTAIPSSQEGGEEGEKPGVNEGRLSRLARAAVSEPPGKHEETWSFLLDGKRKIKTTKKGGRKKREDKEESHARPTGSAVGGSE